MSSVKGTKPVKQEAVSFDYEDNSTAVATPSSDNKTKKGKKPTYDPSRDTLVASIRSMTLAGKVTCLSAVKELSEKHIIHLTSSRAVSKSSKSCFIVYKTCGGDVSYTVNEDLIGGELKLRNMSKDSGAFYDLIYNQIEGVEEDGVDFDVSIYATKINDNEEVLKLAAEIKRKEDKKLFRAARKAAKKNKNEKKEEREMSVDEDEVVVKEENVVEDFTSDKITELDGRCWFYATAGDKKWFLPLNVMRPSDKPLELNLKAENGPSFPLFSVITPLSIQEGNIIDARTGTPGYTELVLSSGRRYKSYWAKSSELPSSTTICSFAISDNRTGSRLTVTERYAPGCTRVVCATLKKAAAVSTRNNLNEQTRGPNAKKSLKCKHSGADEVVNVVMQIKSSLSDEDSSDEEEMIPVPPKAKRAKKVYMPVTEELSDDDE